MTDLIRKCVDSKSDTETIKSLLPCLEIKKDSLHAMIRQSNMKVLELLLTSKEIDVNFKDFAGDSPLHIAAKMKNVEAVKLLLSKNAEMTCRNNLGITPIFIAFEQKYSKVVAALLAQGQKWYGEFGDIYKKYYQLVKYIYERSTANLRHFFSDNKNIDIDFKKLLGIESPLLLAVASGKFEIVEDLLVAGADVNYRKADSGVSALHVAVRDRYVDIVDLLLEYNADVNCYISETCLDTPLHYAIETSGRISLKMLLEKGALVNYPAESKAFVAPLHLAAQRNEKAKCKLLINFGANVNHMDENGITPLSIAIEENSLDLIELFLANKANPNLADNEGNTSLFWICELWKDHAEGMVAFQKLIGHGADVDARNNCGDTILHVAYEQVYEIAEFLLEEGLGPDVNCLDGSGCTPLALGGAQDCDSFMLLLRHGSDINVAINPNELGSLIPISYTEITDDEPFNNLNCPVYAHFEKLKLLGYKLDEVLWSKYQQLLCKDHAFIDSAIEVADFEIELKQLKTTKICFNSQTTLCDVLLMKQNQVTRICNNEQFEYCYRQDHDDFKNSFPHYGWLLNLQYRRGHRRRKLMDSVAEVLETALGFDEPDLCTWILRYLTNDDLKYVLKSEHK